MTTQPVLSGAASGMFPALILKSTTIYRVRLDAVKEYGQNPADEDMTRNIWFILDRKNGAFHIVDDGPGMGGMMPAEDRQIVDEYYNIVASGESPGCELRDIVSEAGSRTLEWFVRNIANSIKGQKKDDSGHTDPRLERLMKASGRKLRKRDPRKTLGQFGIGAWSYLSFARQMVITSVAHRELAEALGQRPGQAYAIMPPTKDMLNRHQMGYELHEVNEPLTDLDGNVLEHGTVVSIYGVDEEAWDEFTFDNVTSYMREHFGVRIEMSGLRITVADLITGQRELVPPQVFRGQVIINTEIESYDGTPCSVLIHYDPKARNLYPRVDKLGLPICLLTDVQLKGQPVFGGFWQSGRVGGRIAYEHNNAGDGHLFDTSKQALLDTPERRHWIREIKKFEPEIQEAIKRIEDTAKNERLNSTAMVVTKALKRTLVNQGIFFEGGPRPSVKQKPTDRKDQPKKERRPLENIIVQVVDKGGIGVQGVDVHLRLPPHYDVTKPTGVSGTVQFGKPAPGEYRLDIITDHPSLSEKHLRFDIDPKKEVFGKRVRFVLDIGDENAKKLAATQVEIDFNIWDDPEEPWRQNINTLGGIELNISTGTDLRNALDWEQTDNSDTMIAEYTAAAIMEALGQAGDHASRVRQSLLFGQIYRAMKDERKEIKAQEKLQDGGPKPRRGRPPRKPE